MSGELPKIEIQKVAHTPVRRNDISALKNLESITLEMAQIQELETVGTEKLSGSCGKLMCCLSYEADLYEVLKKKMPKIGSEFKDSKTRGKVVNINILEGKIIVEIGEGKKVEVKI